MRNRFAHRVLQIALLSTLPITIALGCSNANPQVEDLETDLQQPDVDTYPLEREPVDEGQYDKAIFQPQPIAFAPGIHMLGRMSPSVVYVIETSEGLVLVDSGLAEDSGLLLQQFDELGLDSTQIQGVLLTHAHGDHTQGALRLKTLTNAKIYAGKGDCAVLREGGPREAIFSTLSMESNRAQPTEIDVELEGGEVLQFGDAKITVIATPGHSPGSVCYLLQRDYLRALFTGDTISSFVSDLGTYAAYLAPRYRGNADDYLQSLRKLKSLPKPDLVFPGHPTSPLAPRSPRLSEGEWNQLLDRGIRDMEQLVTRHRADGTDFLDGNPKQLLDGLYYLGDHEQYPVYALVDSQHLILVDSPGSSGLVEFVRERLQSAGIESRSPTCVLLTSCDPDAIAGLRSLVDTWNCRVVAATEQHEKIRQLCPAGTNVMSPQELKSADWFDVRTIPLAGRGNGPVA
jgi:glyoxylase-like metal-dependent hydrolase (beta-lactamase superfamily II)